MDGPSTTARPNQNYQAGAARRLGHVSTSGSLRARRALTLMWPNTRHGNGHMINAASPDLSSKTCGAVRAHATDRR